MSANDRSSQARNLWVLTGCGVIVCISLGLLPLVVGNPSEREFPDWARFLGRFHPVVLHLPIGVFLLILIQEIWRVLCAKRPGGEGDSILPLGFGVVSAIVAVLAGFLLYRGHGDEYAGLELAERHLWAGLAFAGFAVAALVMKQWAVFSGTFGWWYRTLLLASVGTMTFASHDGASITHGEGYLTKYAPDPIRRVLGMPAKLNPVRKTSDTILVYEDLIAPIFENRCVRCHKQGKAKGKLRMDTHGMLLEGGTEGPALIPGNAEESLIVSRIRLPEDDEEHMPPEGKNDLESHELALLVWWINQGADPSKVLSDFEVTDEIRQALDAVGKVERK